jgi:hypothetical protein
MNLSARVAETIATCHSHPVARAWSSSDHGCVGCVLLSVSFLKMILAGWQIERS